MVAPILLAFGQGWDGMEARIWWSLAGRTSCSQVLLERERVRRIGDVLLTKQDLIELLVKNGDEAKAWDLEGPHFPRELDTEKDRELLVQYGIDVESLLGHR